MRQKITIVTAVALCFALTFGVTSAVEREVDYTKERSKQRLINGPEMTSNPGAVDMSQTFADEVLRNRALVSRTETLPSGNLAKASSLVSDAIQKGGDEAISDIVRALALPMPEGAQSDKIRATAYQGLAQLTDDATKTASYLNMALTYVTDPAVRAGIESQIAAAGGDVVDIAFTGDSQRVDGFQDTCLEAGSVSLGDTLTGQSVFGPEHDWWAIDINSPSGGAEIAIETFNEDPAGSFIDDTDLTLYASCEAFDAGTSLAFDDDGGVDFLSLLDGAGCLANGTYYLEVGGWADVGSAEDFSISFTQTAECVPPMPDLFEPDADRENASLIGRLVSGNPFGLFKGTVKKEIAAHNFFPVPDNDVKKFYNIFDETVLMETSCQFPTVFNDFQGCEEGEAPGDTIIQLLTNTPEDYGGRCNDQSTGFVDFCRTDLDCDFNGNGDPSDDLIDPVPDFPACVPRCFFTDWPFGCDPLFASDDDDGEGFASSLTLCLPSGTKPFSPSAMVMNEPGEELEYFWYLNVIPFSPNDSFDYEVRVSNLFRCDYEQEPNQDFADASQLSVNGRISGIYEFSEYGSFTTTDADLYEFDVDVRGGFDGTDRLVSIKTDGYSTTAVDTFIELFVGPDENGDFFFTGLQDEDGGDGFLSRIDAILPTADNLLGVTLPADVQAACDNPPPAAPWWWPSGMPWYGDLIPQPEYCGPSYFLNVTSAYLNANFPYDVITTVFGEPTDEVEPNDDCDTNANAITTASITNGEINPSCDFDTYKFTLEQDGGVIIETFGAADTAIQVVDCSSGEVLACDDDSGPGLLSLAEGCLPAGEYCVQVRAFNLGTGAYELDISGAASCVADSPPSVSGDGAFTCSDFDTCP